jgi:hypothetical protein
MRPFDAATFATAQVGSTSGRMAASWRRFVLTLAAICRRWRMVAPEKLVSPEVHAAKKRTRVRVHHGIRHAIRALDA